MQRRQDVPSPGFAANTFDGIPSIYFPSSNIDPDHNQPSTPAQNSSVINLTTQNPQYASVSYKTPPPPQNNHSHMPPHSQNTHHQTAPPPQNQNQNTFNPLIPHHHLNQNTNAQTNPQNYQTAQNTQSPFVDPPLPKMTTFRIPIPTEHNVHGSKLDHYEEQEREWRSKEEAKVDIKEDIKKSMKELECIPDIAKL